MKFSLSSVIILASFAQTSAFSVAPSRSLSYNTATATTLFNAAEPTDDEMESVLEKSKLSDEEVEKVGNLVADDEWMGLGMELSEIVRCAVIENAKAGAADFIGKDEYKVGDISKEIDSRVKDEIAKIRGKDEYELGDLTGALDQIGKDMTCELTGKDDYEVGDLTNEIDSRVKGSVAAFCGKDEYEVGDLSAEIDKRSRAKVFEFIGKDDYEFGDISKEVENRRVDWMKSVLGEEAASNYEFGDLSKKALTSFTGKDEYEFGDVSKKIFGSMFGKRKRGGQ